MKIILSYKVGQAICLSEEYRCILHDIRRQIDGQSNRQTYRRIDRQAERYIDRHITKRTYTKNDRQIDKKNKIYYLTSN